VKQRSQSDLEIYYAILALGDAARSEGKPQQSKDCYLKALQLRPNDPTSVKELAGRFSGAGDNIQAVNLYQRLISLEGNTAGTYFLMAYSQLDLGQISEAKKSANMALKLAAGGNKWFFGECQKLMQTIKAAKK
jgi:tetratricopeptide (TPR) repeat protein